MRRIKLIKINFANSFFLLLPDGSIYWPTNKTLILGDLHLEKSSFLARLGNFLPPYDSFETLYKLNKMSLKPTTHIQNMHPGSRVGVEMEICLDKNSETEIKELANFELTELIKKNDINEKKIKLFLLPKDVADSKNAIIEIRAGTGGLEASLFASDLYKMYEKISQKKNWNIEIISISKSEAGGLKEVISLIKGKFYLAQHILMVNIMFLITDVVVGMMSVV